MKPNSTFNLSKSVKRVLATITDPVARGVYKNQMIQAELEYEHAKRIAGKSREKNNDAA